MAKLCPLQTVLILASILLTPKSHRKLSNGLVSPTVVVSVQPLQPAAITDGIVALKSVILCQLSSLSHLHPHRVAVGMLSLVSPSPGRLTESFSLIPTVRLHMTLTSVTAALTSIHV